jgi:hypothetical protein
MIFLINLKICTKYKLFYCTFGLAIFIKYFMLMLAEKKEQTNDTKIMLGYTNVGQTKK